MCKGITKRGEPCKFKSEAYDGYCFMHASQAPSKQPKVIEKIVNDIQKEVELECQILMLEEQLNNNDAIIKDLKKSNDGHICTIEKLTAQIAKMEDYYNNYKYILEHDRKVKYNKGYMYEERARRNMLAHPYTFRQD